MDHHRVDRVGLLSPLEESSAEISRDSGIVSQSASSLSMVSEILSSGTVSQSPSFGAAANVTPQSPSLSEAAEPETAHRHEPEQDDEVLRHAALGYSSYIKATAGEEVGARGVNASDANIFVVSLFPKRRSWSTHLYYCSDHTRPSDCFG